MEDFYSMSLLGVFTITSLLWYVYVVKLKGKLDNLNQNIEHEVLFKINDSSKHLQKTIVDLNANVPILKQESYNQGFSSGKIESRQEILNLTENLNTLQNTVKDLNEINSRIKHESYLEGYQKGKSEFSLKVSPYRDEIKTGDDGFIINDISHEVRLGYQYQLFINGVPALEPAVIIEEYLFEQKREVDFKKIDNIVNLLEAKMKTLASESKGTIKFFK